MPQFRTRVSRPRFLVRVAAVWVVILAASSPVDSAVGGLRLAGQNSAPRAVPSISRISAGESHICALTSVGAVKCWGDESRGVLGKPWRGDTQFTATPIGVAGLASGVKEIAAGNEFTCAITSGRGVKCLGFILAGSGSSGSWSAKPVSVAALTSGVRAIAARDGSACALTSVGAVKCWGAFAGSNGATPTLGKTPADVVGLTGGVRAIAVGGAFTCALTVGGAVKCLGVNTFGELGDGATGMTSTPVDVTGLTSGVKAIAAGEFQACAITSVGGAKCWGYNSDGQLGNGARPGSSTAVSSSTPVDVAGLTSGVRAITTGNKHTCALTSGGGVKCWGNNANGQLGNGSKTNSSIPVNVAGLGSGVISISTGADTTCALTNAHTVKCWGSNAYGQLGSGSRAFSSTTPVKVRFPSS